MYIFCPKWVFWPILGLFCPFDPFDLKIQLSDTHILIQLPIIRLNLYVTRLFSTSSSFCAKMGIFGPVWDYFANMAPLILKYSMVTAMFGFSTPKLVKTGKLPDYI